MHRKRGFLCPLDGDGLNDFVNQTSIASEGLLVMMVIVFVMLDVAAQNGTHFSKHAMRVVPVQEDG